MNDSYGDGWSNGSTVELKIDYYSLGSYSCSGYSSEVNMIVIEPPPLPTTLPPTTLPPTTQLPTTLPPTTLPPTTQPPTTLPPTTQPPTTLPPTTQSPTTQPPTTPLPTSFICNENIYPTIESIPTYATELIFEENSYPGVLTVDFSRFTQLHTLIVKDGAFRNCYDVNFNNPFLNVYSIGENCFSGIAPTTQPPTTLPTSFICNENIYPTIESIPTYATELIFEENSYPGVLTVDFSRFTQLHTLIVKDGAFRNCYDVNFNNPFLNVYSIGENCFSGIAPSNGT